MQYICLAAGKGTRFGRLGTYLQKCMYPVGLRPFLELSLQNLMLSKQFDIHTDKVTFIVGHYQEQIKAYFGTSYEGLHINYLEQLEPLGTGHALYIANEMLKPTESVIAWLADTYLPDSIFSAIQNHEADNVQTIGPGPEDEKPDLKVSTDNDLIAKAWCGEEPYYDIGVWKLSPEVLSLMMTERHKEYRMVPNLQYAIHQGYQVGFIRTEEWLHLGGTLPSPEENVKAVLARIFELEAARDHR